MIIKYDYEDPLCLEKAIWLLFEQELDNVEFLFDNFKKTIDIAIILGSLKYEFNEIGLSIDFKWSAKDYNMRLVLEDAYNRS